jgi:hypothetical protein
MKNLLTLALLCLVSACANAQQCATTLTANTLKPLYAINDNISLLSVNNSGGAAFKVFWSGPAFSNVPTTNGNLTFSGGLCSKAGTYTAKYTQAGCAPITKTVDVKIAGCSVTPPPCAPPTNVRCSGDDANLKVEWDGNATAFTTKLRRTNGNAIFTNTTATNSTIYTGVPGQLPFEVMVQAKCGNDTSVWTAYKTCTTTTGVQTCRMPTNIAVSGLNCEYANLSWVGNKTCGTHLFLYENDTKLIQTGVNTCNYANGFGDLKSETRYAVYIVQNCGCSNGTWNPSTAARFEFRTPPGCK